MDKGEGNSGGMKEREREDSRRATQRKGIKEERMGGRTEICGERDQREERH